jgi:hypothetical protein
MPPDHPHATSLRDLPLRAGASLTTFVSFNAKERSRTAKIAVGLLSTSTVMVLAQRLGADIRAVYGSGQPEPIGQVVRSVLSRPAGG